MSRRALAVCLISVLGCSLACATAPGSRRAYQREAGTGDVAFRLVWNGASDLDLFVEDPAGACIFFGSREAPSGGLLDIDCNGGSYSLCTRPVENVFWPTGTAPAGRYMYWIHAHSVIPDEAPLPFELQLLQGTRIVWRHSATLQASEEIFGPFVYELAGRRSAAPAPARRTLPDCPIRSHGEIILPAPPKPSPPGA